MPGDPRLRAADADRERACELLREHWAAGRLTAEEFQARTDQVLAARTLGELDGLLADLPAIDLYRLPSAGIRPARRPGGPGLPRRAGDGLPARPWVTWGAGTLVLVAVWLVVGLISGGAGWLPWFVLVVLPWAVAVSRRRRRP